MTNDSESIFRSPHNQSYHGKISRLLKAGNDFANALNKSDLCMIQRLFNNDNFTISKIDDMIQSYIIFLKNKSMAEYLINYGIDEYNQNTLNLFIYMYILNNWSDTTLLRLINHCYIISFDVSHSIIRYYGANEKSCNVLIENAIDKLNMNGLNNLLKLYVTNGWSSDIIKRLIDYGANIDKLGVYCLCLPDDIFVEQFADGFQIDFDNLFAETDLFPEPLYYICKHLTIKKMQILQNSYNISSYILMANICYATKNESVFCYIIDFMDNASLFALMMLLSNQMYSNHIESNFAECKMMQTFVSRLNLTQQQLFMFVVAPPVRNQYVDIILDKFYTNNEKFLNINYRIYYKYNVSNRDTYLQIIKNLETLDGMKCDIDILNMLNECLELCPVLMNEFM